MDHSISDGPQLIPGYSDHQTLRIEQSLAEDPGDVDEEGGSRVDTGAVTFLDTSGRSL